MGTEATWRGGRGRRGRGRSEADTAADRLPLFLPSPSPLPGRIKPEASVPCAGAFDAAGWLFSVDWSGCRALLFAGPDGGVRLQNERLDDITARFPEVARSAAALGGRSAVIDGVIAILDPEGRPDPRSLGVREASSPGADSAVFLATDLLHVDEAPLMAEPLEARLDRLARLLRPDARIQFTEPVPAEGMALAEAAAGRDLDAVLARRAASRYHPGVASPDRLRIELVPQASCVLAGIASRAPGWGERVLVLAEYANGRLVRSGVVAAALDPTVGAWLDALIPDLAIPTSHLEEDDIGGIRWLRPHIVATVAHGGRRGDGTLLDPRLVALRDDIDPLWCRRRSPVAPPGFPQVTSRFRPTVLVNLPMSS